MEIVRPEFSAYIAELRQTLASILPQLATGKARDDVSNASHILGLIGAELDFLRSHEAQLEELFADLLTAISDDASPHLSSLKETIRTFSGRQWNSSFDRLAATRVLLQDAIPALDDAAESGVEAARLALQRLLEAETAQFEAVNSQRRTSSAALAATSPTEPAATAERVHSKTALRDYLRRSFSDEAELEVERVVNVPGGRSKETTLIELSGCRTLPSRIVMRADLPGGLVPSKAIDEYRVIEIAARHGVPVPMPLLGEPDPEPLGRSFILVSMVPGSTRGEYFADEESTVGDRQAVGAQLAGILARIHTIPLVELSGTHLDLEADLVKLASQTIEATYAEARSFNFPARMHLEVAYRWLRSRVHLAADEPCLIHCDVGLHNMLIEGDTITAMLDWELATISSPARELAKILHLIDYLMPREQFFAAYLQAGGASSAVDPQRLEFYAVMNYMVTHQRARLANRLFFSGQRRDLVMAHAGYDSYYRGVSLLTDALKSAGCLGAGPLSAEGRTQ